MKKRYVLLVIITLCVFVGFGFKSPDLYSAAKTKKMKTYNTIKSGKNVYCVAGNRILKVNLNTEKVTKLVKGKHGYISSLVLKGRYLYYLDHGNGLATCYIYRVNTKTKKKQKLASKTAMNYAISGKKIYYEAINADTWKSVNKVMKLNGKSKKSTKIKAKRIIIDSNSKNYSVWNDFDQGTMEYGEMVNYYLSTPKGDIFLIRDYPLI